MSSHSQELGESVLNPAPATKPKTSNAARGLGQWSERRAAGPQIGVLNDAHRPIRKQTAVAPRQDRRLPCGHTALPRTDG